jgi:hypothetical protein
MFRHRDWYDANTTTDTTPMRRSRRPDQLPICGPGGGLLDEILRYAQDDGHKMAIAFALID